MRVKRLMVSYGLFWGSFADYAGVWKHEADSFLAASFLIHIKLAAGSMVPFIFLPSTLHLHLNNLLILIHIRQCHIFKDYCQILLNFLVFCQDPGDTAWISVLHPSYVH